MINISTLYRCGWCGQPTNDKGSILSVEEANSLEGDWDKAEPTYGECCMDEQHWIHDRMRREMGDET